MLRRSWLLLIAVTACAPIGRSPGSSASPASSSARPNIVFLLSDDLGIGEIGPWGQRDIATPNIDRLAREGVRFTEFRSSAGVCGPARCSLMLGLHNGHCRLDDNDNDYLRPDDVTLAERLHYVGYATGLFGKWGLSWDSKPESWPNAQGFDAFFGYRDQVHAHNYYPEWLLRNTDSVRLRNVIPVPGPMGTGRATTRLDYAPTVIRERAFEFVRRNHDRPFFLYWAATIPHIHNEGARGAADGGFEADDLGPYADRPWPVAKKNYAALVHHLDQDLGRLRTLLDSLGIADNTLVLFGSDNGATFLKGTPDGTTDIVGRWFNGTMGYRGFKGDLFDGGLRVPLIALWPGHTRAASVSDVRADFTDLHATLVEAAGGAAPSGIDGRSFLAAFSGRGTVPPKPFQVWYSPDRDQKAVLAGRWKEVWMRDSTWLFDLEHDPGERTNLLATEPLIAARLDSIRRAEDRRVVHPKLPGAK